MNMRGAVYIRKISDR